MKKKLKIRSVITGVGGYLPAKILTNDDLSKMVDTTNEWILTRTGISKRHIAAKNELTSDLAIRAAKSALKDSNCRGKEIDMIILATTTPDETCPSTATKIQQAIGMTGGFAFDIQAACSGFMYALSIADNYIQTGIIQRALVVGAETLSRIVDWQDRSTCVLFGDGAGAVVLEAQESKGESGIIGISLHSDGKKRDLLKTTGGVSLTQKAGVIEMQGREVFRFAIEKMEVSARHILKQNHLSVKDVDWFVPHQANLRILQDFCQRTKISMDKTIITLAHQGNTSAASIPLALWEGISSDRIHKGDLMLLESMGAGLTWATGLIRY